MWYFCKTRRDNAVHLPLLHIDRGAHLERGRVRDADREVCEDGESLVGSDAPEREVVRDLMDGKEEIVIRGAANHVRREEENGRQGVRVSQEVRKDYLQRDDKEYDPLRQRFVAHKLRDL